MYASAVMESISFTQLLSVDFGKKNGVHPCIYKMCKYNKRQENEWWNDYSVGRQCTAIGMVLHKEAKVWTEGATWFYSVLLQETTDMSKSVNYTRLCLRHRRCGIIAGHSATQAHKCLDGHGFVNIHPPTRTHECALRKHISQIIETRWR